MLVEKVSPGLVEHTVEMIASQQPPGPGLTELKSTPSSYHSEKLAIVAGAGWLGRLGEGISNSIGKADVDAVPPCPLAERGVISVMAAALPQLGALLSDEGDILTRPLWGPGASVGRCAIHRAAWRALCVLSTRLCSASTWMRLSDLAHVLPSSTGRPASNSTDKAKYTHTEGVWWLASQALLTVLFSELTRAHERLKVLVENQEVEGRLMIMTQAARLMVGSRPLPLPKVSAFPLSFEDERNEQFAVTFWIWIPDFLPRNPHKTCEDGITRENSLGRTDVPTAFSRAAIYAPVHEILPAGGSSGDGFERHPEVALVRFPPLKEHRALPGSRDDGDRVSIEFTILERADETSSSSGAVECIGDDRSYGTPAPASTIAVEAGGETPPDSALLGASEDYITPCPIVERLVSDCPLPTGCWTHVCCSYSVSEESVDRTCGASQETPRSCIPIALIAFDGRAVANRALPTLAVDGKVKRRYWTQQNQTHGELRIGKEGGSSEASMEPPSSTGSSLPNNWQTSPAVCDLLWHQRAVSIEQAHQLASSRIPQQREKEQLAAECYVNRLATLAHEVAISSPRVAAELSSSRWLALWLAIIPVVRFQAQRASLRLLRPLLCTSERAEGVQKNSPPAIAHIGPCSLEYELTDRAVIDYLCSLLGEHLLPPRDDKWCYHFGGKRHELDGTVMDNLNESGVKLTRVRRCTAGMKLCHASSTVSDIILLLRVLVWESPTRWRPHIDAAMTAGLVAAGTGALRTLSGASAATDGSSAKSLTETESKRTGRSSVWLGAAVAAAYVGGGHIEGPRVGGRVTVLPHDYPPVDLTTAGAVPGSEETVQREVATREGCLNTPTMADVVPIQEVTCAHYGTVLKLKVNIDSCDQLSVDEPSMLVVAIAEHCRNCVDQIFEEAYVVHQSSICSSLEKDARSAVASTRIAAVPMRQVLWEAEIPEPMATFLLNGESLPAVQTLLESATVRNPKVDTAISQTGDHRGADIGPSWESVVEAHIRCRLVRALAVQFRHIEQAVTALRGTILDTLLTLSSAPLPSATILALGLDGAVAFGQRRDFAAVILCLDHQRGASSPHSLMADLQTATQAVWTRMSAGEYTPNIYRPRDRMDAKGTRAGVERFGGDINISSSHLPILQVVGGEAVVEGNRVTASSHFPTIRLSDVNTGSRSAGGRWYYEVTLLTGGLMQLGWASSSFQCSPTRGQGVGDHLHSWAFDGFRQKRWCVSSASYGKRWRAGDVVGVLLDVGLQEMRFRYSTP